MSFFISEAYAQSGGAPQQGGDFQLIILMGGFFLFMYIFMIRPQRKRQKEHEKLIGSLGKGDEVVMTSGMLGKVSSVDDLYVTVDAGKNLEMKFQKASVHAVLPKGTIKSI